MLHYTVAIFGALCLSLAVLTADAFDVTETRVESIVLTDKDIVSKEQVVSSILCLSILYSNESLNFEKYFDNSSCKFTRSLGYLWVSNWKWKVPRFIFIQNFNSFIVFQWLLHFYCLFILFLYLHFRKKFHLKDTKLRDNKRELRFIGDLTIGDRHADETIFRRTMEISNPTDQVYSSAVMLNVERGKTEWNSLQFSSNYLVPLYTWTPCTVFRCDGKLRCRWTLFIYWRSLYNTRC